MKYLKLFEDYKTDEDMEDILLQFIDDGECVMEFSNEYFKEFGFVHKETFKSALKRLKKFNVDNYFTEDMYLYINWYSKEIEDFLLKFLNGIEKIEEYPNEIIWRIDGIECFKQNLKHKTLNVRYDLIWSVFEKKYMMSSTNTRVFIKYMINKHDDLELDYRIIYNIFN